MRIIRPGSALLPAVLVLLSCSDPSGPRTPTSITVVAGGGQTGLVMELLPQPIVVEVKDVDGRAVSGASVAWSVSSGAGSVSAPTTTTDRSGRAQVQWTLGSTAGQNRLNAGVTGVAPAAIMATAQTGPPASAAITAGNGQTGLESLPLGDAIVVQVRDAHNNGVPGTAVTFTPSAGVVTPQSVMTDASGVAAAIWTLGDAGDQNVAVSVAGIAGGPLHVTATALAPGAMAVLLNDEDVTGVAAGQGENRYYRIVVPANVTRLTVSTVGGPGDVDVFVRHERLPTTSAYACRSITPSATERCTVELPAAGDWYVLLDAYSAYSDVALRAAYLVGGNMGVDVTGLPAGSNAASIVVTGPERYERQLTATSALPALAPGRYTVTASFVLLGDAVYVPTPEVQEVDIVAGAESNVAVAYALPSGGLNLDIARAYITQAVQRFDGSIPLIAGRDGLLRVLVRGNAISTVMPVVRARFYHSGTLVETMSIPAPSSPPVMHDERTLSSTWNVTVPGALIQPGMSVLVDVDPDSEVAEEDETDNHFPVSGTPLALDVRAASTLQARLVPVVQGTNGLQGDVTEQNRHEYVSKAQALYPLPGIDVDVRAPYTFDGVLPAAYDTLWGRLLTEISALRIADSSDRYYYGVIKPAYTSGGTGLGFLNHPAALGVDWPNWRAETVAHEWGHNFGRYHVDCGGPSGIDPNYPYVGGRLGHHGYDFRTSQIRPLDTHYDLMSYCAPTWTSDYTYEAVMDFRALHAGTSHGTAGTSRQPSLLVWGRISADGVVLEPSFEIVAAPVLPRTRGKYRLTGTNDRGATVFDISFDAHEIDHLPDVRLFAYAIPLSTMGGQAPAELRLRGAGVDEVRRQTGAGGAAMDDVRLVREGADRVRFQWNAARTPLLMVRDGRTGEIISFARGGDVQVTTSAVEVEITMSDGVRSTMRRIAVPR